MATTRSSESGRNRRMPRVASGESRSPGLECDDKPKADPGDVTQAGPDGDAQRHERRRKEKTRSRFLFNSASGAGSRNRQPVEKSRDNPDETKKPE